VSGAVFDEGSGSSLDVVDHDLGVDVRASRPLEHGGRRSTVSVASDVVVESGASITA
jgi:hypothetical protein